MKKILLSLILLSSSFAFGAALEGEAGAIPQLVTLLGSEDDKTKKNAVFHDFLIFKVGLATRFALKLVPW